MGEELFSFKELYDVYLKATYNIEIGNRTFVAGEPIAHFDKIQIAGLQTVQKTAVAHGGFNDAPRVIWESTKQVNLTFSQGVFSKRDFALLTNSGMVEPQNQAIYVTTTEYVELDEDLKAELQNAPTGQVFIYNENGEKLPFVVNENYVIVESGAPYQQIIVTYQYDFIGGSTFVSIGRKLVNGFLQLEGKTRVKDDTYGMPTTGLIVIPKLKLTSNLSIMLGAQANPVVANFQGVGMPYGEKGTERVCEFYFLNSDLDSDM